MQRELALSHRANQNSFYSAKLVGTAMKRKYAGHEWVVIRYGPVSGFNNHTVSGHRRIEYFRGEVTGGAGSNQNLVMHYFPTNKASPAAPDKTATRLPELRMRYTIEMTNALKAYFKKTIRIGPLMDFGALLDE